MDITDEEAVLQIIEYQLNQFSSLRSVLPPNYPRHSKYEITPEKMRWYSNNRDIKNWNHFNLPLVLHTLWVQENATSDEKLKGLSRSILKTFDDFSKEFSSLPGFRKTLEPLWTSAWNLNDPQMWSVLGECFLALLLHNRGHQIHGFGLKIGSGQKNSDICIELNGKTAHIDIEIQNLTETIMGSRWQFRKLLKGRAFKKIGKKFEDLPKNELGAIACIYSVKEDNFDRFSTQNLWTTRPVFKSFLERNPFAQIYWIAGGRYQEADEFKFHIVDRLTASNRKQDRIELLLGSLYNSKIIRACDNYIWKIISKFSR